MKICLVCSHGGHLTEMNALGEAFRGHDTFYLTYDSARTRTMERTYTIRRFSKEPLYLMLTLLKTLRILSKEKPDVIVSTGAEIAIPAFLCAKLLGIKSIYIESAARVTVPSATGKIVYPFADYFVVQWPSLLKAYGAKARYLGGLL